MSITPSGKARTAAQARQDENRDQGGRFKGATWETSSQSLGAVPAIEQPSTPGETESAGRTVTIDDFGRASSRATDEVLAIVDDPGNFSDALNALAGAGFEAAEDSDGPVEAAQAGMNDAFDEIAEEHGNDEKLIDAMNLVVNASLYFAEHPNGTLEQAIEDRYGEDSETVLGWIK